jgi:hypothetical protein
MSAKVTEYILRDSVSKEVFSHSDLDVLHALRAQKLVEAAQNGTQRKFKVFQRDVVYPDVDVVPTGEAGLALKGDVVEKEIS